MKSLDFEAQSTLSYALSNGILDLDRVHELCMASKREQAKALHPYSITPPAKEGERWRTNYTDRNGNCEHSCPQKFTLALFDICLRKCLWCVYVDGCIPNAIHGSCIYDRRSTRNLILHRNILSERNTSKTRKQGE